MRGTQTDRQLAYQKTKSLLLEKKGDVENWRRNYAEKRSAFKKSDVEALIGKRPFEEKPPGYRRA